MGQTKTRDSLKLKQTGLKPNIPLSALASWTVPFVTTLQLIRHLILAHWKDTMVKWLLQRKFL